MSVGARSVTRRLGLEGEAKVGGAAPNRAVSGAGRSPGPSVDREPLRRCERTTSGSATTTMSLTPVTLTLGPVVRTKTPRGAVQVDVPVLGSALASFSFLWRIGGSTFIARWALALKRASSLPLRERVIPSLSTAENMLRRAGASAGTTLGAGSVLS